jgi:L-asparaginase/Glu-tRNA(Gln) amidotransferase subunit D
MEINEKGELTSPKEPKDFEKACGTVIQQFVKSRQVKVDFILFDTKDSSDRTPEDWTKLSVLMRKIQEKYIGIVIVHGTDTLAQTASALSLGFTKV